MEKAFLLVTMVTILTWVAQGQDQPSWSKRVDTGKEVVTTLQFYFHDKLSGSNPSAVQIAQATGTNNSSTLFGSLWMIDDPLTVGPDPTSKLIGRARGLYGSAGQTDMGLIMVVSYGFTDGIYQGSSFSLLSLNPALNPVREMAIVGGTGLFRLARGYAIAQTYSANANGDAIVGYNVTIVTKKKEMEKQIAVRLISLLVLLTMATAAAIDKSPKAVEKWFKNLPNAKPKTTKFHFYFHETFGGDNQTGPVIAQANITAQSPTFFGMLRMFDNPLTVGPDPNSKQVGRAQGIHGSPSMSELALFFNFNFVFTDGLYNGSTLSVMGRVAESQEYRELSIIGGSGVFRLAKGVATGKTYFSNDTFVSVEYSLIILHY